MKRTYWTHFADEYDSYSEALEAAERFFDLEDFVQYLSESVDEGETTLSEILLELHAGNGTDLYFELYRRCFNRYAQDNIDEWTEYENEEDE